MMDKKHYVMNLEDVLIGFYKYVNDVKFRRENILIILNDVRVENYFLVQFASYLEILTEEGNICSYDIQYHFQNIKRTHIDIKIYFNDETYCFIELKHFTISQTRISKRNLKFYTNNSKNGIKLGIISDCIKFDNLRTNFDFPINSTICLAIITDKPTKKQFELMEERFESYSNDVLNGWNLIYPILKDEQLMEIGMFALQK